MKRDDRLIPLSHDHHHGLVMSLRIRKSDERGEIDDAFIAEISEAFDREVEPHFKQEERWLLPALRVAGEDEMVDRTLAEHAQLRGLLRSAAEGDINKLIEFGELLGDHIRFEERELFERAQTVLSDEVLDDLAPHFHAQK